MFRHWRPGTESERAAYRVGFSDMLPVAPGTFAWGLVTGVAMMQSGLTLAQSLGMTLLVFAGSAQLSALPLIAAGSPVWVVVVSSLLVNLRFVIYAAAMRNDFKPHTAGRKLWLGYMTGDAGFVLFMEKIRREGHFPHKDWYFSGGAVANWLAWQAGSLIGIFAAAFIPMEWGLDLAGLLALLAMLVPMCNSRPALVGALVAGAVAVLGHGLPMRLGLPLAVVAGIASAVLAEPRRPRPRRCGAAPAEEAGR